MGTIIGSVNGPLSISLSTAVAALLGTAIAYRIILTVYRLYLGPLSKFPGPRLYAISHLPYLLHERVQGTLAKDVQQMHERYGPIVRISPDRLSIDGSIGWPDVFAPRGNAPEFEKTIEFYQVSERVGLFPTYKEDHRRQRRLLSHAFSSSALQEQEGYVKYYVDLLIRQLRGNMEQGKVVDMTKWYNYTTFDIIGELAFADPFNSLANSNYHPWVALIFSSIKAGGIKMFLDHYWFLKPFILLVFGKDDIRKFIESRELAKQKTEKRLAQGVDESRKDFMTYILRHNSDNKGMTHDEILVNCLSLIVAGSETTATALSGLTFHLTKNPEVYQRLAGEIRAAFSSEESINMTSTSQLQYLQACLEEILRIYPPAAETPPRISPGETVGGQFVPKGTYITIYQWPTHHSPRNFADPEKFAPERWLPVKHPLYDPKYSMDNKAACKPFSYGPRDCIGKNLAYSEMRLVIARMLWNFDLELLPGQDDWVSRQKVFIVYNKGPLMIRLKPASKA
ncbi:putative Isotrichodermin C-15 hydroxylase [Seiridium unicorne]|uniref:Isotrichodermin C-15 hydroxylase n=1 Tax=Seiridium unicorne TaxID=138068 RepID=A0ABR2VF77_9PEZI